MDMALRGTGGDFVALRDLRPGKIMFNAAGNRPILTINPDGTLERGEGFATNDEASMAFFDVLSRAFPSWIVDLRHRAEKAEAELARYAWRPIETAPKDGQLILTMLPIADPAVAFWVEREKAWCFASYDHEHKARGYMGGRAIPFPQPTHWMPLPAAPTS